MQMLKKTIILCLCTILYVNFNSYSEEDGDSNVIEVYIDFNLAISNYCFDHERYKCAQHYVEQVWYIIDKNEVVWESVNHEKLMKLTARSNSAAAFFEDDFPTDYRIASAQRALSIYDILGQNYNIEKYMTALFVLRESPTCSVTALNAKKLLQSINVDKENYPDDVIEILSEARKTPTFKEVCDR